MTHRNRFFQLDIGVEGNLRNFVRGESESESERGKKTFCEIEPTSRRSIVC